MAWRMWSRHVGLVVGFVSAVGLVVSACGGDGTLAVGDDAPDFSLSAADGESVTLDGYRDEAVLLYFHMADG